jgi:hypothetical protein
MRASTHTTRFTALSRTIIIILTFISDFSAHFSQSLYPFDLTHESAELLGTVLPLTPPPSLVICFSLVGLRRLSFFLWAHILIEKNDGGIDSEISIWIFPPTTKKNNSCTERTKDRHPRPIRSLRHYATQPQKRGVAGGKFPSFSGIQPFKADRPGVLWPNAPCMSD